MVAKGKVIKDCKEKNLNYTEDFVKILIEKYFQFHISYKIFYSIYCRLFFLTILIIL